MIHTLFAHWRSRLIHVARTATAWGTHVCCPYCYCLHRHPSRSPQKNAGDTRMTTKDTPTITDTGTLTVAMLMTVAITMHTITTRGAVAPAARLRCVPPPSPHMMSAHIARRPKSMRMDLCY